MELRSKAHYTGGRADQHRLSAIEGAESILGFSRSIQMIMNYGAEGRIRHKMPYSEIIRVELAPARPGSFDAVITALTSVDAATATVWLTGAAGSGLVGNALYDLVKTTFKRCIGEQHRPNTRAVQRADNTRDGDLDALIDAVEPSIIAAHRPIGNGANKIVLIKGSNNVVTFNEQTKQYVNTVIRNRPEDRELSVASYNANSRYGRVFDPQLNKTVSFTIPRDIDPASVSAIVTSLQRYATDIPGSLVTATVSANAAIDGRIKHYRMTQCRLVRP